MEAKEPSSNRSIAVLTGISTQAFRQALLTHSGCALGLGSQHFFTPRSTILCNVTLQFSKVAAFVISHFKARMYSHWD